MRAGSTAPAGTLGLTRIPAAQRTVHDIIRDGLPSLHIPREVAEWREENLPNLMRGIEDLLTAERARIRTMIGSLRLAVIRDGRSLDLGLASLRVVTDAGVAAMVDAFQNTVELENLKYHGIGTGTTAEAAGDTALVTELTTEYNPNSTRATGTTTEGATANIYRTVGTNTLDSGTPAITEHGVFSQAATGGGTLLDRSVFSAINLDGTAGDGLQSTYELTITAGS